MKRFAVIAVCWLLLAGSVGAQVSTTSLVAAWELNEASGNATDSHGSNTLTDNNTVGAGTGLIYSNVRDFERGNSEYFSIADNASVSTGDIDFTFELWIKLETGSGTRQMLVAQDSSTSRAFNISFNDTVNPRFAFQLFGSGNTQIVANAFGDAATATWYQVIAWHDSAGNQVGISVNRTENTASWSGGVTDGTAEFCIGRREYSGFNDYTDGLIGPVRFWKRVLTTGEKDSLYNSGAGLAYSSFGGGGNGLVYPQIIGSLIRPTPWSRFLAHTPIALLEAR